MRFLWFLYVFVLFYQFLPLKSYAQLKSVHSVETFKGLERKELPDTLILDDDYEERLGFVPVMNRPTLQEMLARKIRKGEIKPEAPDLLFCPEDSLSSDGSNIAKVGNIYVDIKSVPYRYTSSLKQESEEFKKINPNYKDKKWSNGNEWEAGKKQWFDYAHSISSKDIEHGNGEAKQITGAENENVVLLTNSRRPVLFQSCALKSTPMQRGKLVAQSEYTLTTMDAVYSDKNTNTYEPYSTKDTVLRSFDGVNTKTTKYNSDNYILPSNFNENVKVFEPKMLKSVKNKSFQPDIALLKKAEQRQKQKLAEEKIAANNLKIKYHLRNHPKINTQNVNIINNVQNTKTINISKKYHSYIMAASKKYKVPPRLIAAVIQAESGFNPNAKSSKNAIGLMQVIPDTGALLGVTEKQLYDPKINIDTGTRYLRQMLNRYDQKVVLALAAYNAGPGRVDEANLRVPNITETQNYVKKILSYLAISSHIQEAKN